MQENAVLIIGLTDQSDYSICQFMVTAFIRTVYGLWFVCTFFLMTIIYIFIIGVYLLSGFPTGCSWQGGNSKNNFPTIIC